MNCDYHTNRKATLWCRKCKKPLCEDCAKEFKSVCIDCMSEMASDKVVKQALTFILSIVFAIAAYVILTKYADKLIIEDIVEISRGAIEEVLKWLQEKHDITFDILNNEKAYLALQVYCLASLPFGYYLVTKAVGTGFIIKILLKLIVSAFISPVIMPIALVGVIISIIKNSIILAKCSKSEHDKFFEDADETPERKLN